MRSIQVSTFECNRSIRGGHLNTLNERSQVGVAIKGMEYQRLIRGFTS